MSISDELDEVREELRRRPVRKVAPGGGLEGEGAPMFEVLIDLNARRLVLGGAVLETPEAVDSIWGNGHQSIWPTGEPLILCGPEGVGKTTLAQQVTMKLAGIDGEALLLGFSVQGPRRVLYLACDRPAQAMRSFARMVSEKDRAALDEYLVLWRGPLPFDLASEPGALLALARRAGCDAVILDSVKDVAADLSREETGLGLNRAFQTCCAEGVDVLALHHQRKAQAGAGKPNKLADVYGSRWLTAGAGSVVMLWGEAGDPVVDFTHLKQPDEPVGPFQIVHDHLAGTSSVVEHVDAYTIVMRSANGVTAQDVAKAIYGDDGRNAKEKAKRQLDRLYGENKVHREDGTRGGPGGSGSARYYPVARRSEGGMFDAD